MTSKIYTGEISYASSITPLGMIMIGASDKGLCSLAFGESEEELYSQISALYPKAKLTKNKQAKEWLAVISSYLEGKAGLPDLPVDIHRGTDFQRDVWKYLQTIPKGHVATYTEVATGIGKPKAFRAVASACAKNNIAIVIPCHRVIRGSGSLAGFRWGLERKRALLDLEKQAS